MTKNYRCIILFSAAAALGLLPINARAQERKSFAEEELSGQSEHADSVSESSIKIEILPSHYHVAGNSVPTWIRLTGPDGKPVTFGELEVAHTKKIHLLIVDESLSDYQHAHPEETGTPGEYRFVFNPKFGGRYHVWADLVPKATGKQEYAKALMTVGGDPAPAGYPLNNVAEIHGYRFELAIEDNEPLQAGKATLVKVRVRQSDGRDFAGLEPVMGAFAHMVGFTQRLDSVMHILPLGKEPAKENERGGPELSFRIVPAQSGYLKLYLQTRIRGLNEFATFGLKVEQPASPENTAHHSTKLAAVPYLWPMRPEMTQSTPGNCPKCGMALVSKQHS